MVDRDMSGDVDLSGVDMAQDMSTPQPGDVCRVPSDCGDALICAGDGEQFKCMERCDRAGTLCEGGEVCTALGTSETGEAVCFLGGSTLRGEPCDLNTECEVGHLCFGASGRRYCLEACHAMTPECDDEGMRCVLTQGSPEIPGSCQPHVGSSCEEDSVCQGTAQLSCSTTQVAQEPWLARIWPSPACTHTGCEGSQECGPMGYCAEVSSSNGASSACIRACTQDTECRFQVGERCWRAADCANRGDMQECLAMLGGQQLCLPESMNFFWP